MDRIFDRISKPFSNEILILDRNLAHRRILHSGREELTFFAILLPELFDLNFPLC